MNEGFGVSLRFPVGHRTYGVRTFALVPGVERGYEVVGTFEDLSGEPLEPPAVYPFPVDLVDSLRAELVTEGFYELPEAVQTRDPPVHGNCWTEFVAFDGSALNTVTLACLSPPPPALQRVVDRFREAGVPVPAAVAPGT